MDLSAAGLREQPFRTHGKPLAVVAFGSHAEALDVLQETCESPDGLALIQGPTLSGKSTIVREFVENAPDDCTVAVVNGDGMRTSSLLETLLRQFGFGVAFDSTNESLGMLRVYAQQQAARHQPPVIIVENAHGLNPSALRVLSELAELRVRATCAVKLVLMSDRSLRDIIDAPAMGAMSRRLTADLHLRPMSSDEAICYLHAKLSAAGAAVPSFVFPQSICIALWEASGGWPGVLDRLALLALAKAKSLPINAGQIEKPVLPQGTWDSQVTEPPSGDVDGTLSPPKLFVSENGKTLRELTFDKARLLIGRSEHNDVSIGSRFISRHHMLLVRHGSATFLMDLNSTNGTFVNSRRVSNHVLIDNDVINVGNHSIKFSDPHATQRGSLEGAEFADTAIMKTLDDMRALLAQENTAVMPAPSENLPTLGDQNSQRP